MNSGEEKTITIGVIILAVMGGIYYFFIKPAATAVNTAGQDADQAASDLSQLPANTINALVATVEAPFEALYHWATGASAGTSTGDSSDD